MKNLIIVTFDAAYGNWLTDELKYHKKKDYDNIVVFSTKKDVSGNIAKDNDVKYYDLQYKRIQLILQMIAAVFTSEFMKEISLILKSARSNKLQCIFQALVYMATARTYGKEIQKNLKENKISYTDRNIFYSYWMSVQAETFFYLRKKYTDAVFVSRAHSIDVYEERSNSKYLEYRQSLVDVLDAIYFISNDAMRYFEQLYSCSNKCRLERMGSANEKGFNADKVISRTPLKIVSCSSIIEVKRLHLLVEALTQMKDYPIIWHHYGSGHLEEEIRKLAEKLPENVNYELKGFVKHSEILEMYLQENYNLFINTSEIEGIPVSMMEALSVGIPILGPDVGGIPEIVKNGVSGYRYNKDEAIKELSRLLEMLISMEDLEYQSLRKDSFNFWNDNYNMDINYERFASEICDFLMG